MTGDDFRVAGELGQTANTVQLRDLQANQETPLPGLFQEPLRIQISFCPCVRFEPERHRVDVTEAIKSKQSVLLHFRMTLAYLHY